MKNQLILFATLLFVSSITFSQQLNETVVDVDGNIYHTITIGNQVWTVENLKTTKYNDGSAIPNITDGSVWDTVSAGAYCIYNNANKNIATYGLLYNWKAVNDKRGLAPQGWHIPTDREWMDLLDFLGGGEIACNKLKELGDTYWEIPNTETDKATGFKGLPGGFRNAQGGEFKGKGIYACWWTSSESLWVADDVEKPVYLNAFYLTLNGDESPVTDAVSNKNEGLSIRLIKNK